MLLSLRPVAVALCVATLGLAACAPRTPAGPEPVTAPPAAPLPPLDRLVAAIEQNGCELSGSTASAVMLRANLTPDQIEALGPDMANDGRFEVNDAGAIRVLTDRCI